MKKIVLKVVKQVLNIINRSVLLQMELKLNMLEKLLFQNFLETFGLEEWL
jgi:hypothetical protein